MAERAVRLMHPSRPAATLQPSSTFSEGGEWVHWPQAFITQSAINALNEGVYEGIFRWFRGLNKVEISIRRYSQASSARDWNFVS
jgi:hypothetical protein